MTFSLSIYHGCTLSLQILLEIRHIALAKFYYLVLMFLPESVSESSRTFNLEQQVSFFMRTDPFNFMKQC